MRILFDVDVVLDALLQRQLFVTHAATLINAVELGQIHGFLAPHALTTIHYLAAKRLGQEGARSVIARLLQLFDIGVVGRTVYHAALQSKLRDFEDAVQAETVLHLGLDGIVTRNLDDYRNADIVVYSPAELVAWLARQSATD
ncbi:MAG: PIN domain-containing protein [Caldilinea sp.]